MTPTFWRAIDTLGSAPAAALTWRTLLGGDETTARPFLRHARSHASTVVDPEAPHRILDVYPDGESDFVAICDERPPLPLTEQDLRETSADLEAIRCGLAQALAFIPTADAVTTEPLTYQIGIVQPSRSQAMPVMIFVPAGLPTDRANFLRALATLPSCVLYVPTSRWQTADAFSLAVTRGISIEALEQRFAASTKTGASLTVAAQPGRGGTLRPIIRVQTGWRWEDISIRLTTRGTLIATHGTERGEHRFVRSGKGDAVRRFPAIFRRLIEISFAGHWQNPEPASSTYEKVSKSFLRLRQTIETLIPIPAESFIRDGNRWKPRFRIQLDNDMEVGARRFLGQQIASDQDDDSVDD